MANRGELSTIHNADGTSVPAFLYNVFVTGLGIPVGQVFARFNAHDSSTVAELGSDSGDETIYGKLLERFNGQQLQMIISNDDLHRLVEADEHIKDLMNNPEFNAVNPVLFNTFKINLGKLQLYAILRKIQRGNCGEVITALTTALNGKLEIVNEMLEQNLQTGGGQKVDDPYFHKYWKCRFKYELAKIEKETL